MNRYKYIIEQRLDTKRRRMRNKSSLPPKINRSSMDVYIIARDGDRLDNLAYEYYNDVSHWWVLAHANALGKGTMNVPPGIRLRIPAKQELHELLVKNEQNR
jgi:hypothetical protein|tara:strand:- start:2773 stop:3078 length:306 start_codon:yes stop_codon:yes gene_type:complete